jgi:hypothetical protein
MSFSKNGRMLCAAAIATLAFAGCGASAEDLEKKVSAQIEKDLGEKPAKVSCPDSVSDAKKGSEYDCKVTDKDGQSGVFKVKFVNDDLDFTITPPSNVGG